MRKLWRHVEYNYREGGFLQVFYKVFWRLQQWLWSEARWLVYKIDIADYQRGASLPLSRCHLGFDSLQELNYFKAIAFPEEIRTRLDSGARCNGFFIDSALVNIAWITGGYLEMEPGVCIREVGCVGIFDCYTLPEHRSKGIYTDALIQLIGAVRGEGATLALIAVDPVNHASIKGIERAGFEPFYRLTRVRRFGRHFLRRSGF